MCMCWEWESWSNLENSGEMKMFMWSKWQHTELELDVVQL